jgi:hypothetical protein
LLPSDEYCRFMPPFYAVRRARKETSTPLCLLRVFCASHAKANGQKKVCKTPDACCTLPAALRLLPIARAFALQTRFAGLSTSKARPTPTACADLSTRLARHCTTGSVALPKPGLGP